MPDAFATPSREQLDPLPFELPAVCSEKASARTQSPPIHLASASVLAPRGSAAPVASHGSATPLPAGVAAVIGSRPAAAAPRQARLARARCKPEHLQPGSTRRYWRAAPARPFAARSQPTARATWHRDSQRASNAAARPTRPMRRPRVRREPCPANRSRRMQ